MPDDDSSAAIHPMPELADQIDDALELLWKGDASAIEELICADDTCDDHKCCGVSEHLGSTLHAAAAMLSHPAGTERVQCIEGFDIVAELGRGGMGVVYEAVQHHPQRAVAIKVMRPGRDNDEYHRRLFEREIRALASLDHPGIASLYDASTTHDGQAFFVMELVRGIPLNEHAHRAGLDVHSRLELFCQLCDGVHHAHLRGVIHRDLKPSNVLVITADESDSGSGSRSVGRVKIMDFGLARLTDPDTGLVSQSIDAERLKGTFAYMSPEQIRCENENIDARSDVYSLGVMLYQLLTGRLPRDASKLSLGEMLRSIDAAPAPPSALNAAIPADLDVIVQTAMAAARSLRYQSAAQLSEDIRRFLRDEPIFARPASAVYQLRLFARRNRALVISTFAVVLALAAGFAGTTVALMRMHEAQQQSQKSQRTADEINAFLNQMLSSADPSVTRAYDMPLSAILDEAARKLDSGALADQADAEAGIRKTIGEAYQSLGMYGEAAAQFQAAVDSLGRSPAATVEQRVNIMVKLARMLSRQEMHDEALRVADEAVSLAQRAGDNDPLTLLALQYRATILGAAGHPDQAQAILCDLLPRAINATGGEVNPLVVDIKGNLGFFGGCAAFPDPLKLLHETLAAQRELFGEDDESIARTLINIGSVNKNLGNFKEAEESLLQALVMRQRMYGEDHPGIASAHYNLASVYRLTQRVAQAEDAYSRALAIQKRRLVPGHYETARTRWRLGMLQYRLGKYEEAEQPLREAIEALKTKSGSQGVQANGARRALADVLIKLNRFEEAEAVLIEALEAAEHQYHSVEEIAAMPSSFIRLYQAWGDQPKLAEWREHGRKGNSEAAPADSERPSP